MTHLGRPLSTARKLVKVDLYSVSLRKPLMRRMHQYVANKNVFSKGVKQSAPTAEKAEFHNDDSATEKAC